MGNRAVITTENNLRNNGIGVYVHWNGGRDSVEAFLTYMKLRGFRTPETDCYGWARLCQVIGNFLGGTLSLGIDTCDKLDTDNGDNGVYIISGWDIVGREFFTGPEQQEYDLNEMLCDIDMSQPEDDRLGKEFLGAPIMDTSVLQIGDMVYVKECDDRYHVHRIVGFGDDRYVCGVNVRDLPYVDMYGDYDRMLVCPYSDNINNYLREKEYRVANNRTNRKMEGSC